MPVFILCGGLGTRLRAVESRPKAVIPVAGLPFLGYSLRLLQLQGFRRICLLVGVGADEVQAAFGAPEGSFSGPGHGSGGSERSFSGSEYFFSREETPHGTGGALFLARARAGRLNLILNGDSYAEALYPDLLQEHADRGAAAARGVTVLALREDDVADYGSLDIDPEGRILAFREKGRSGPGWINAGVYAAGQGFFEDLRGGPSSLERDILPVLAREGRLWARRQKFFFRDIGTPERLALARREFRRIRRRWPQEAETAPGRSMQRG